MIVQTVTITGLPGYNWSCGMGYTISDHPGECWEGPCWLDGEDPPVSGIPGIKVHCDGTEMRVHTFCYEP